MLSDVVAKECYYGLAVTFYLTIGLWMVCSGCRVFDTKECAHCGEGLACKLRSIVGQQKLCYRIEYNPVLIEYVRDVH